MEYSLSYGNDAGKIQGTAEELCALLDGYPDLVVLEVVGLEKIAGSEVYPVLVRYAARRMVKGLEG